MRSRAAACPVPAACASSRFAHLPAAISSTCLPALCSNAPRMPRALLLPSIFYRRRACSYSTRLPAIALPKRARLLDTYTSPVHATPACLPRLLLLYPSSRRLPATCPSLLPCPRSRALGARRAARRPTRRRHLFGVFASLLRTHLSCLHLRTRTTRAGRRPRTCCPSPLPHRAPRPRPNSSTRACSAATSRGARSRSGASSGRRRDDGRTLLALPWEVWKDASGGHHLLHGARGRWAADDLLGWRFISSSATRCSALLLRRRTRFSTSRRQQRHQGEKKGTCCQQQNSLLCMYP